MQGGVKLYTEINYLRFAPKVKCEFIEKRKQNRFDSEQDNLNAFSFLERDASCGFNGNEMKPLGYITDVVDEPLEL